MKAKQYADMVRADNSRETWERVVRGYFKEIDDLVKLRHVNTDAGLSSIFDELDQKWKAMANNLGCAPDGFRIMLEAAIPETYKLWMELRANNGRPMPKPRVPTQAELDLFFWKEIFLGGKPWTK